MFKKKNLSLSMTISLTIIWIVFIFFSVSIYTILDGIKIKAEISYRQKLPYAQLAIQSKLHILSIWQWLTDISATRGFDGLDEGFEKAVIHKDDFYRDIQTLRAKLIEAGDTEGLLLIGNLVNRFAEFYSVGQEMAQVYVAEGPRSGNRYMTKFDEVAEVMLKSLDLFVKNYETQLSDSLSSINNSMRWIKIFTIASTSTGIFILWLITTVIRNIYAALKRANNRLNQEIVRIKETEDALRRSESFKSTVLHSLSEGIVTLDDQGRVIDLNPAMEQIFGYSSREARGKSLAKLFLLPELRERHAEGLNQYLETGQSPLLNNRFETSAVSKDGSLLNIEMIVNAINFDDQIYFTSSISDITPRKLAEKERLQLATAMEQIVEGVMITDVEGTIQYVNPAFERITGYPRDEAAGKNSNVLNSGKHDKKFFHLLWQTILSGEVWQGLITNRRKDGSLYKEEMTVSPIRNEAEEIVNFVAVKRDVTREMEMEAQLSQSQKMEAIGVLSGGIAHDFNNILMPILGYTEIATRALPRNSKVQNYLDAIFRAALRAKDLVAQILLFSRQTDGERHPLGLEPLVKEVLKLLRSAIPKTIEIKYEFDPELPLVSADATQIHSVLMNLCTNANHAMPDGGVLSINLQKVKLADYEVRESGRISGEFVRLSVADNGLGMNEETLARIFDPFFTTKETGKGTGLGLSTVYGIVQYHQGYIAVESAPGQGTKFEIFLPRTKKTPSSGGGTPATLAYMGSESILLIDDEEDIVSSIRLALAQFGYEVTGFSNPVEAMEHFRSNPGKYDLVITDRTMPLMTGEKVAGEVSIIAPDLPIIICTGNSDKFSKEKLENLGIDKFIMKPFTPPELGKAIRQVMDMAGKNSLPAHDHTGHSPGLLG